MVENKLCLYLKNQYIRQLRNNQKNNILPNNIFEVLTFKSALKSI